MQADIGKNEPSLTCRYYPMRSPRAAATHPGPPRNM